MTILEEFNKIIVQFMEQINDIIYNNSLNSNIFMFKKLLMINDKIAISQFIDNIYPFKDKINAHDENFFLEKDVPRNDTIDLMKIKDVWKLLSNDNKKIVFDYFNALLYICDLYLK